MQKVLGGCKLCGKGMLTHLGPHSEMQRCAYEGKENRFYAHCLSPACSNFEKPHIVAIARR
jgi:hypothetical protein